MSRSVSPIANRLNSGDACEDALLSGEGELPDQVGDDKVAFYVSVGMTILKKRKTLKNQKNLL